MGNNVVVLRNVFDIVYETKGTECIRVYLSEGTEIPSNWEDYTLQEKDEWLYEHQVRVDYKWKDIDRGDVVQIKEIK